MDNTEYTSDGTYESVLWMWGFKNIVVEAFQLGVFQLLGAFQQHLVDDVIEVQ